MSAKMMTVVSRQNTGSIERNFVRLERCIVGKALGKKIPRAERVEFGPEGVSVEGLLLLDRLQ